MSNVDVANLDLAIDRHSHVGIFKLTLNAMKKIEIKIIFMYMLPYAINKTLC